MSSNPQDNPLLNELVTFIQHDVPGLQAGEFKLTISQRINDKDGKPISDKDETNSYTFAVLADRFRLKNPSEVLYTVFPEDNGRGEYSTVLPHVVFTKSTFPWARTPARPQPPVEPGVGPAPLPPDAPTEAHVPTWLTSLPAGAATEADVPTWLAVLLFDADDVAAYPALSMTPVMGTIGDLYPPSLYQDSTLGDNYSYFYEAKDTKGLDIGDKLTDPIQTVDVPLELFWKIAPTIADLELLAHVRKVSLLNKPTIAGVSDVGEPVGTFSIVFGNRLPQTGMKTFACLVSLEGLQPFLPTDENGGPPAGHTFNTAKFLRLAVLTSWTFYSTGQSATFVEQLLRLNGRPDGSQTDAENTNLRIIYKGSNQIAKNALSMGYVPLNNGLRTGGKTVSWYRGPLIPYLIDKLSISFPISSPDEATAFDPTTGMFDDSLAAAWTIGRMVALQDPAFSTALYQWKQGMTQQVVNYIEEQILRERFSFVLDTGDTPAALEGQAKVSPVKALFHKTMQTLQPNSEPERKES